MFSFDPAVGGQCDEPAPSGPHLLLGPREAWSYGCPALRRNQYAAMMSLLSSMRPASRDSNRVATGISMMLMSSPSIAAAVGATSWSPTSAKYKKTRSEVPPADVKNVAMDLSCPIR